MVQETSIDRFMKLKEQKSPNDWIADLEDKRPVYLSEDLWASAKDRPKSYFVLFPYEYFTFYELFDSWEEKVKDYKIYQIMKKEYWVVEVKDE